MSREDELLRLRTENDHLRSLLMQHEGRIDASPAAVSVVVDACAPPHDEQQAGSSRNGTGRFSWNKNGHNLNKDQIARYSRQIIMPSFGAQAQSRLCNSSILVIGVGGLGCPVIMYLAAAGVGRLGMVDRDLVELNNLHRQIAHRESTVGTHKVDSAGLTGRSINSSIQVEMYRDGITPQNAVELISSYDVVIDATDNAPSRYLISDACVVAGKPLVSGAAIGTDGQLTVYNYGPDGPCYRCLFPEAPEPQSCSRCSDAGVLGIVPGIIGSLQALEAIKIASAVGKPLSQRLLLFDALAGRFTAVKLRAKMPSCIACGEKPSITAERLPSYSYAAFTGAPSHDAGPVALHLLDPDQRRTAQELQAWLLSGESVSIVDVRPESEFNVAHMPGATNCPFSDSRPEAFSQHIEWIQQQQQRGLTLGEVSQMSTDNEHAPKSRLCVICRRGNDSQRVVKLLQCNGVNGIVDLVGGLEAWCREPGVDFPGY